MKSKYIIFIFTLLFAPLFLQGDEKSGFYERPEWKETELKAYKHWTASVSTRQTTLGSAVIKANRSGVERISDLSDEELAELKTVMKEFEDMLEKNPLFHPDRFNYLQLGNLLKQLHFHVIPRYSSERVFAGETWIDNGSMTVTDEKASRELIQEIRQSILGKVRFEVARHPVAPGAFELTSVENPESDLFGWSKEHFSDAYDKMQVARQVFAKRGITNYMIVGTFAENEPFYLQFVPLFSDQDYKRQHLKVLARLTFGKPFVPEEKAEEMMEAFKEDTKQMPQELPQTAHASGNFDCFMDEAVLKRQTVYEGKTVKVYVDKMPLGRHHFTVFPIKPHANFEELTKEEYLESMEIAKKVTNWFRDNVDIRRIYFYAKNGGMGGQSVPHYHMHIAVNTNLWDELASRYRRFRNLAYRKKYITDEELDKRVEHYREAFKELSQSAIA